MTGKNRVPGDIDVAVPNVARIYDYLLGGKDNFAADREAAGQLIEAIGDVAGIARDNRSFLGRVVRYLALEPGLTWIAEWRPEPWATPVGRAHSLRGGVGRKA